MLDDSCVQLLKHAYGCVPAVLNDILFYFLSAVIYDVPEVKQDAILI